MKRTDEPPGQLSPKLRARCQLLRQILQQAGFRSERLVHEIRNQLRMLTGELDQVWMSGERILIGWLPGSKGRPEASGDLLGAGLRSQGEERRDLSGLAPVPHALIVRQTPEEQNKFRLPLRAIVRMTVRCVAPGLLGGVKRFGLVDVHFVLLFPRRLRQRQGGYKGMHFSSRNSKCFIRLASSKGLYDPLAVEKEGHPGGQNVALREIARFLVAQLQIPLVHVLPSNDMISTGTKSI
mmetsp:Transcript_4540/g.17858  ORF Transcript_4540/g.17858 Transcript_4540/m.17858 type:complete len:238 (-) Transcript_4540:590-1303(-)